MYILVRQTDNVIVGTAFRPIDEASASKSGCRVYDIPDAEFNESLLGSKLESFETENK